MKISCQREPLLKGIAIAATVAPPRTTKPILAGVKISADASGALALATDLEVSVRATLREVIVEKPGEVVLPAQTLVEILRSIESSEVGFDTDGRYCEIRAADVEYKLVTDDPEEFPAIPATQTRGVVVPRAFVEDLFQRTSFAAARDIGRYAINGVLVEMGEGQLRFVATDGRRLAVASRAVPEASGELARAILPLKGLQEALRGSEGCETLRIAVGEDRVVFVSDASEVMTKPVDGEFPGYQAVIPRDAKGSVEVGRDALLAALRKASVMAGDEMRSVRVEIGSGSMKVSAQVEGRGRAKTQEIEAEVTGIKDFTVDYNPDFLMDFLKPVQTKTVRIQLRDPTSAAVLVDPATDDLYVVMPITTS